MPRHHNAPGMRPFAVEDAMRIGGAVSLGAALALGGLAVMVAKASLKDAPDTSEARTVTHIVVARTTLGFGSRIGRDQLALVSWPPDSLPAGAFTSIDQVVDARGERVAMRTIEKNEPLLADKVSEPGGRATLSTIVDREMRAFTIRVNDVVGVAGFILPGDRVDILFTRHSNEDSATTDILLQNIRVLGIDQEAGERKDKPLVARAVTLEVDPHDAQKLALAAAAGTLTLALRNRMDGNQAHPRTIRLDDLRLGPAPSRPVARAAPSAPVWQGAPIAIMRGTKTDTVMVANGEAGQRPADAPRAFFPQSLGTALGGFAPAPSRAITGIME